MTPKFMELHSTKFHEDFEGFDDAYIGCNCYGNNNNEELDHRDDCRFLNTCCDYYSNEHE